MKPTWCTFLFLVYFINFVYNLYMFWTSPGPSSGGNCIYAMLGVCCSVI